MPALTQRERLIAALTARGWTPDTQSRSTKHFAMQPPPSRDPRNGGRYRSIMRYYIGRAGSLRFSATGRKLDSHPDDKAKAILLAEQPARPPAAPSPTAPTPVALEDL